MLAKNGGYSFPQPDVSVIQTRCAEPLRELQKINAAMKKRLGGEVPPMPTEDQILEALRRFWRTLRFGSFRDALRTCAGLALQLPEHNGKSVLDSERHFLQAVLDGLKPWRGQPRLFRRCFYGLMHSFFTCDLGDPPNEARTHNHRTLRDYLRETSGEIFEPERLNPDWAHCLQEHVRLFNAVSCAYYADKILAGDTAILDPLRGDPLRISQASWFWRELVLSQIEEAVKRPDNEFTRLLERLLNLLEANILLRDRGLAKLLERYVHIPGHPLHGGLRDAAIRWWRNPWLPLNAAQWGGVSEAARNMVAGWLKREFIEEFFRILAEDGNSDKRRATFWLRYVKSMGDVRFALGHNWTHSFDKNVRILLDKMRGLYTSMDVANGSAFIMTLGNVVVVEFGKHSNAVYVYNSANVPFDLRKPAIVAPVNGPNSLKNQKHGQRWFHKPSDTWPEEFERQLRQYGVRPDDDVIIKRSLNNPTPRLAPSPITRPPSPFPTTTTTPTRPPVHTPPPSPAETFSFGALRQFAAQNNFRVDNRTPQGGCVWAFPEKYAASSLSVARQLSRWGFRYKEGKGWWLKP